MRLNDAYEDIYRVNINYNMIEYLFWNVIVMINI